MVVLVNLVVSLVEESRGQDSGVSRVHGLESG